MAGETEDDAGSRRVRGLAAIRRLPPRYYVGIAFLVGLLLLPQAIGVLDTLKMSAAFYFVVFVLSWDFVSGYTGQVSFGHTLFFTAGGYTTALLNLNYGVDPILGIVAGVVVAGFAGIVLAIPALRIEGHYLALFTLLPPLILLQFFQLFRETFGGTQGLPDPDNLIEMGDFVATAEVNYYLAFGVFLFVFGVTWVITRSDTGRIFTAIRESEDAVASAGINPDKFKVYAFGLSAMLGGLGGAVFVHSPAGSASPSQLLVLGVMIEILIATIFGGFGTISGAMVGGFFIYWIQDWFSNLEATVPVLEAPVSQFDQLLFAILMLALLLFLAEGMLPFAIRKSRGVLARVRGGDATAVTDGGRSPLERVLDRWQAVYEEMIDRLRGDR